MKSPASGEVMGIDNMLNQKAGSSGLPPPAQGVKPEHQPLQQLQSLQPLQPLQPLPQMQPMPLERADSPHGSEHSRYSGPRQAVLVPAGRMALRPPCTRLSTCPSQTWVQALRFSRCRLRCSRSPIWQRASGRWDSYHQSTLITRARNAQSSNTRGSTCGKCFARRSDLARHG